MSLTLALGRSSRCPISGESAKRASPDPTKDYITQMIFVGGGGGGGGSQLGPGSGWTIQSSCLVSRIFWWSTKFSLEL